MATYNQATFAGMMAQIAIHFATKELESADRMLTRHPDSDLIRKTSLRRLRKAQTQLEAAVAALEGEV